MLIRALKLIQNGQITVVPDHPNIFNWREYVNLRNEAIRGSRNYNEELITLLPATKEEIQAHLLPKKQQTGGVVHNISAPVIDKEKEELKAKMAKLEEALEKLLAKSGNEDEQGEEPAEQKRRGRPAKTA